MLLLVMIRLNRVPSCGIVVRCLYVNADPNYNQTTDSQMRMLTDTLVDTPYNTQDPQSVANTV